MEELEAGDLLWGAAAIAKFIGRNRRVTFDLLKSGHLAGAATKLGRRWVGSKRGLAQIVRGVTSQHASRNG
jgi:hypothetical protein